MLQNSKENLACLDALPLATEILDCARWCRDRMEAYVSGIPDHQYKPDPEELDCMCAISSQFLTQYLFAQDQNWRVEFVVGEFLESRNPQNLRWDHCWVEINGWIIDLTAKQFDKGLNAIHITPINDSAYKAVYRAKSAYKNIRDEWPREQKLIRGMFDKLCKIEIASEASAPRI